MRAQAAWGRSLSAQRALVDLKLKPLGARERCQIALATHTIPPIAAIGHAQPLETKHPKHPRRLRITCHRSMPNARPLSAPIQSGCWNTENQAMAASIHPMLTPFI
jgi:hypothetical protein